MNLFTGVLQGMKVLVDAQKKLGIPLTNKENSLLGDQLLLFDNTASLNNNTFPQFKTMITKLWSDEVNT